MVACAQAAGSWGGCDLQLEWIGLAAGTGTSHPFQPSSKFTWKPHPPTTAQTWVDLKQGNYRLANV